MHKSCLEEGEGAAVVVAWQTYQVRTYAQHVCDQECKRKKTRVLDHSSSFQVKVTGGGDGGTGKRERRGLHRFPSELTPNAQKNSSKGHTYLPSANNLLATRTPLFQYRIAVKYCSGHCSVKIYTVYTLQQLARSEREIVRGT